MFETARIDIRSARIAYVSTIAGKSIALPNWSGFFATIPIDATEVLLAVRTGSGKLIFQIVSVLAYLAIAISAITIIKVLIERRKE